MGVVSVHVIVRERLNDKISDLSRSQLKSCQCGERLRASSVPS